jgi:hypothetical protein
LLGFTGRGGIPGINKRTAVSSTKELKVEYEHFLRKSNPSEIKVSLETADSAQVQLRFSKDFYKQVRVEQVVPVPQEVFVDDEGITYQFERKSRQMNFVFYLKPNKVSTLNIDLSSEGNNVSFSQIVYP